MGTTMRRRKIILDEEAVNRLIDDAYRLGRVDGSRDGEGTLMCSEARLGQIRAEFAMYLSGGDSQELFQ